jgi:hypothetical protein
MQESPRFPRCLDPPSRLSDWDIASVQHGHGIGGNQLRDLQVLGGLGPALALSKNICDRCQRLARNSIYDTDRNLASFVTGRQVHLYVVWIVPQRIFISNSSFIELIHHVAYCSCVDAQAIRDIS